MSRTTNPAYVDGLNQSTTLNSLGSINSPYINGLLYGSKWGSINPDILNTTSLTYYLYGSEETNLIGETTWTWEDYELTAIMNAHAAYENVSNILKRFRR